MSPEARTETPERRLRLRVRGFVLAIMAASALINVLTKPILLEIPPFTFTWMMVVFGIIALTVHTFLVRGERLPGNLGRGTLVQVALIGIANFTFVRLLFLEGLARLPATTHAYLINFTALVTMALSIPILNERPSLQQVMGAVLALVGLWIFFGEIPPPTEFTGVALVAAGILFLALVNNLTRRLLTRRGRQLTINQMSLLTLWFGGLPIISVGLMVDGPLPVGGPDDWAVIAANGIVGIAVTLNVFNRALRTLRAFEVSILASTGVLFTALFAVPILGERLGLAQLLGIAITVFGITATQTRKP